MFRGFPKSADSNITQRIGNPPKLKSKSVFCMWSDLLGFSNHFTECNWNLSKNRNRKYMIDWLLPIAQYCTIADLMSVT